MAINFPGGKFFSGNDAKSRIFILIGAVFGIGLAIFLASRYLGGGNSGDGGSEVASAPSGLQSVPGGKTSAEYSQAILQANEQAAQQAQMTGGSAIPTLINTSANSTGFTQNNCSVVCPSDENIDVSNQVNDLVKQGKISPETGALLNDLAKKNVPPDEYAAQLAQLVKEGKITPEQARQLLTQYKKQYEQGLLKQSAAGMDELIRSGKLPVDAANGLLLLQKSKASPAEYAEELNRLVREGKISPETAAELLAQYNRQLADEGIKKGVYHLQELAKAGTITPEVANRLAELQKKEVPVSQYAAELQRLVAEGKLTPAAAAKLLEEYKAQHANEGNNTAVTSMLDQAQKAADAAIDDMVKNGEVSPEAAVELKALQNKNLTPEEYQKELERLVKEGKISPEAAQKLLANYKTLAAKKALANRLNQLQGNNASPAAYAEELKRAVEAGIISPEEAQKLLQTYETMNKKATGPITPGVTGTGEFAELQQRLAAASDAETAGVPLTSVENADFVAAQAEARRKLEEERKRRIEEIENAMSAQAQNLLTAWEPEKMQHVQGTADDNSTRGAAGGKEGATGTSTSAKNSSTAGDEIAPIIKAGTIYYAVLDTAVDSDYPDTPVMATIVDGPFKGSKLLGKLNLAQGKDRISLTFNLMNRDDWKKGKTINAFAVDPDNARTVMASSVNYHYLMRYGALMASSFLTGYASAITQAGDSTTGIFGTSTTHPNLSPGNRIAVGLGQVGTAFSNVVQSYVNTPATVKVDAGVGIGILYMDDVT